MGADLTLRPLERNSTAIATRIVTAIVTTAEVRVSVAKTASVEMAKSDADAKTRADRDWPVLPALVIALQERHL